MRSKAGATRKHTEIRAKRRRQCDQQKRNRRGDDAHICAFLFLGVHADRTEAPDFRGVFQSPAPGRASVDAGAPPSMVDCRALAVAVRGTSDTGGVVLAPISVDVRRGDSSFATGAVAFAFLRTIRVKEVRVGFEL